MSEKFEISVNGKSTTVCVPPTKRLSEVLREDLHLKGTKVGCNAGDCGACTVLIDNEQVCSCLTPLVQAVGRKIETVESIAGDNELSALQKSFERHGAAQCGICTPGMLVAATSLLRQIENPSKEDVKDAIGGVLCRCTGYQKIVEAILDVGAKKDSTQEPDAGSAVGVSIAKVDAASKLRGSEKYGSDDIPANALWVRIIRSPYAHARISIGDFGNIVEQTSGLEDVLSFRDIPFNRFGIYPTGKDQPVLCEDTVRYRGDAIVALVGERSSITAIKLEDLPIEFGLLSELTDIDAALAESAMQLHPESPRNVLIEGTVRKGNCALKGTVKATGDFHTRFVEHAYIEPEAGWAERVGDRNKMHASTQAVHMDRDEIANVLQIDKKRIRVIPTACGGGFGGKLDVSVQPVLAVAAYKHNRPVAMVYERPESMMASTKRHPSRISCEFTADKAGLLQSVEMTADFNTGAYASWGPTVAGRVPVHGSGPYYVPNVKITGRGIYTNGPPAGAFRGFGVPQAAIAHECMMDDLAEKLQMDRLEIRLKNALQTEQPTATGQKLKASAGLIPCLTMLEPHWIALNAEVSAFNAASTSSLRHGVGIGAMWYGIGNTALSNPSIMEVGIDPIGQVTLFNGAVDIGQGSNTILLQICADAVGLPVSAFKYIMGDSDLTEDAGKTSASRQTFVSGKAAELAGLNLREQILRHVNAGDDARLRLKSGVLIVEDQHAHHEIHLAELACVQKDQVFLGRGQFDPPTTPLDGDGQGEPYATYGFAAQIALVEVDTDLGTTKVIKIIAAHDVGRAINPQQVEGQIHGGIAQGLGLALMEEYVPGKTENLHDYLIPTVGDMPQMTVLIVEDHEPLGPYGAKGVGEPGLVPTAPAIFGAIRHATGVRVSEAPMLPHRLKAALKKLERKP